jgi:hypothetical protein
MLTTLKNNSLRSGAALAALAISLPAMAGTPKALTMVPGDSEIVVVMPNVGELLSDMDKINAMMGEMGKPEVMMMTSMVRGMPGMDLNGSAAIVVDMQDDWEKEPDAVVLLPVTSFEDLTQGREAVNGLVEFPMGNDPIYFRDIGGGYAAMSNDQVVLAGFRQASHTIEEAQAMLGTAGNRVAEANDVMVYLSVDALRPMAEDSFDEMEQQGDMIEMMMGAEAAQGFDTFMNLYKTAVADGQAIVTGMSFDADQGVAFDFGLQFSEGSDSAAMFNNNGDAGSYFNHVPQMDFFFAQAFDLRGEGIQTMINGYMDMVEQMDVSGMVAGFDMKAMMDQFQGGAQILGASDAMMMKGLLANTVMYTEGKDADACIAAMQKMYKGIGNIQEQGVSVKSSFSDEPSAINGIQAYTHSMSFDIDPAMMGGGGGFGAPDPAMIMQMMYGPTGGPAGYAAKAGDGMIFTFSQDEDLLTSAYKAANGENTMMSNKGIAAAAGMLPDNRVMEAYVGVDHILNTVGPILMMFGIVPEFEPIDGLTPVAFGATADGGGMMVRSVLPLQTVMEVMKMIPEDAMGGGNDDWGSDDDDDDEMEF